MRTKQSGITLLELLVVVAVLAILAGGALIMAAALMASRDQA